MRYRKLGPLVHLWWLVSQATSAYWTCPTPLPVGMRPGNNTYLPAVLTDASGYIVDHTAMACVGGSGEVGLQAGSSVAWAANRGAGCFVPLQ